jgi:hypothetical protein
MTWIKLEEKAPRHPKVSGLSHPAFRVWVTSLCYASEFLTDGILPPVYLLTVKAAIREELIAARLWEVVDGNSGSGVTQIHDYLGHQSDRASIDHKKAINRDRQSRHRNALRNAASNALVTQPESREQIQRTDTENRKSSTAAPLIMSPLAFAKRSNQCAFVGSRLEVPHSLHVELRKQLGGADSDSALMAWYLGLNAEIEESGEAIAPDVFRWLKARYAVWQKGAAREASDAALMARLERIERGEIKR